MNQPPLPPLTRVLLSPSRLHLANEKHRCATLTATPLRAETREQDTSERMRRLVGGGQLSQRHRDDAWTQIKRGASPKHAGDPVMHAHLNTNKGVRDV